MEAVTDFEGLQNHWGSDCSHKIKRCSLLGGKLWPTHTVITLPTKVHLVKAMVFPVVMYGCESWTIKKAECQRTDAFELWCWRRLLKVPWTAGRSNQSIPKEVSPEYSLERLMLKMKYFGHLMWRTKLIGKDPDAGKDRSQEEKGTTENEMVGWHYRLDELGFEQTLGVSDGQGNLACCSPWGCKSQTLNCWTEHLMKSCHKG